LIERPPPVAPSLHCSTASALFRSSVLQSLLLQRRYEKGVNALMSVLFKDGLSGLKISNCVCIFGN
jgi:hypothetical protein